MNKAEIRCLGLWGWLRSDSAVHWAENPSPDLACLCFCSLLPSVPASGEGHSLLGIITSSTPTLINGDWVYASEASSRLNYSILRFYTIILKRVLTMGLKSSFCLLPIRCFFISRRVKTVKMKSNKNLIDLIIFIHILRVCGTWYMVNK